MWNGTKQTKDLTLIMQFRRQTCQNENQTIKNRFFINFYSYKYIRIRSQPAENQENYKVNNFIILTKFEVFQSPALASARGGWKQGQSGNSLDYEAGMELEIFLSPLL